MALLQPLVIDAYLLYVSIDALRVAQQALRCAPR